MVALVLAAFAAAGPPLVPDLPSITALRPNRLVEVAADGSWAAFQTGGRKDRTSCLQIWNLRTGALDRTLRYEETGYDYQPVIDPRGKWLAYHSRARGEDGYNLQILDFRTSEPKARTGLLRNGSRSLGFNTDGTELYAADHESAGGWVTHAYSTADGKLLRKFWVPDVRRFDLAPDGRTAVIEYTRVYDLSTGKAMPAKLWNGPPVGFLNDSKHVAVHGYQGGPHSIVVFDVTTGKRVREITVPRHQSNDRVRLSADGRTLAVSRYGSSDLEVFDVGSDRPRFTFREFTRHPDQMRFTPDGSSLIAFDRLGRFAVIDTRTGQRRHTLAPDSYHAVRSLAFADGGKSLVAGLSTGRALNTYGNHDETNGRVVIWDTTTGGLRHAVAGLPSDLTAAFPTPKLDRALVVFGEQRDKAEWRDLNTGKGLSELVVNATHYSSSPDGRFVAALHAGGIALWENGKRRPDIAARPDPHPPQFTADDEWLLYREAGEGVRAVRVSTGNSRLMRKLPDADPPGSALPLPGGDGFVARSSKYESWGDICLYLDGRRIRFAATKESHTPLTISPDGKWVASGQRVQFKANPAFLWQVPTPAPLDEKKIVNGVFPREEQMTEPRLLRAHAEQVTAVAFSPDGKTLATGGTDRTVRLWDVATGKLRATLWAPPSPDPDAAPVDWVAFTPDGFFAGTDRGQAFLRFRDRSGESLPSADVADKLHRPDKVREALVK